MLVDLREIARGGASARGAQLRVRLVGCARERREELQHGALPVAVVRVGGAVAAGGAASVAAGIAPALGC